ncbi:MAG: hypothetical protein V1676_07480 [Candidatus Diapherotrites archaeon]
MYGKIIPAVALAVLLFGCASEMTKGTAVPQKEAAETVGRGIEAMRAASGAAGEATPEQACIALCKAQFAKGADLSNGPCLANPLQEFPEWVCDVVHSPRADVDNVQENQCSAFGEGRANHFVEVDESCAVIKVY